MGKKCISFIPVLSTAPSTGSVRIRKKGKKVKRRYSYFCRCYGNAVEGPNFGMRRYQSRKREGVLHIDYYLEGRLVVEEMGVVWRCTLSLTPLGCMTSRLMDRALFVSGSESWCQGEEEGGMIQAVWLDHGKPPKWLLH